MCEGRLRLTSSPCALEPNVMDLVTEAGSLKLVAVTLAATLRRAREGAAAAPRASGTNPVIVVDTEDATCSVCKCEGDVSELLLCDGCHVGLHMGCANPPIEDVPEGDWYCPTCCDLAAEGRMKLEDTASCVLHVFHHSGLHYLLAGMPEYDEITAFLTDSLPALSPDGV